VLLINDDPARAQTVNLHASASGGGATMQRLQAPSVRATNHVSLGGQNFASNTTSAGLTGTARVTHMFTATGAYTIRLGAASADLITLP
jgi:hypothetical protein